MLHRFFLKNFVTHVLLKQDKAGITEYLKYDDCIFGHFNSMIMEKEVATHSSIPARIVAWTEEPGGLQYIRSQRVRHNLATE